MISALLSERIVHVHGEAKSELDENMSPMDCDPTKITSAASGKDAKPSRRATKGDWST
jgi:hypothetical protein